jgi:hypothetical protein
MVWNFRVPEFQGSDTEAEGARREEEEEKEGGAISVLGSCESSTGERKQ